MVKNLVGCDYELFDAPSMFYFIHMSIKERCAFLDFRGNSQCAVSLPIKELQ